ncbi:polymorphic toxin-type HINT domain-containing protein [Cellulophaga sp. BC115SP]|uniref:polymorphic toxin-type HINT domain-containing protein n=1 Tax=Cellulophaga sp. BC115SP TaxID=2683263 RepID=UPI00141243BE|nr:polymorphic toxin-type HINT domain-containing protein [Cellulophaga sp. BC115SP]NBB31434.1 hypothetical protein [Cellulophaga sp. BC115SP]
MKKQFIYLLLLWVTFNGFSQKLSVSIQNTVDTKHQLIERITNFSPSYFMQSPQRLLEYWGDEVLDIKLYSEKERSFQEKINETLAKKFVLAHAESHDEDFPNDNYQLPLEQRLIDNEPITPYTWKWVSFEIRQESGRTESVKLCRPNWFLRKLGATAIGKTVYLSIPETDIDGYAIVTKISPCQLDTRLLSPNPKSEYIYRPITGQFQHQQAEVWDFEFSDGSTIGATSNHPFFSLERGAYVAVGELKLGETVKNSREKTLKLTSKTLRTQTETVYNLEVYRDHTYLVGDDGVLVHNACWSEKFKAFYDEFKDDIHYKKLFESDKLVINFISEADLNLFGKIKKDNGIGPLKNIAKTDYSVNIGGQTKSGNHWAISGFTNEKNPNLSDPIGLPPPSDATSIFKGSTFNDRIQRGNDSEVKLLDKIAKELGATSITQKFPNATGKVKIISELFPCASCTKIINLFKEMFPNIELEIVAQSKQSFTR